MEYNLIMLIKYKYCGDEKDEVHVTEHISGGKKFILNHPSQTPYSILHCVESAMISIYEL